MKEKLKIIENVENVRLLSKFIFFEFLKIPIRKISIFHIES